MANQDGQEHTRWYGLFCFFDIKDNSLGCDTLEYGLRSYDLPLEGVFIL